MVDKIRIGETQVGAGFLYRKLQYGRKPKLHSAISSGPDLDEWPY